MARSDTFDIVAGVMAFIFHDGTGTAVEISAHLGFCEKATRRALRALHARKVIRVVGLFSPSTGHKPPIYGIQYMIPEPDNNRIIRRAQCVIPSKTNSLAVPTHLFS